MSDQPQAYRKVPIQRKQEWTLARGGRLGVTVKSREIEVGVPDHLTWALLGFLVASISYLEVPGTPGIAGFAFGMMLLGWALNNALTAWRADRVEVDDE
jgi:hypothetical protein